MISIAGIVVIFALVVIIGGKLLKAWESGHLPFATSWPRSARRNIPYYQPSHQPSYQQGYQAQATRQGASTGIPKADNPSEYEQPQAQYPEQMPPMM